MERNQTMEINTLRPKSINDLSATRSVSHPIQRSAQAEEDATYQGEQATNIPAFKSVIAKSLAVELPEKTTLGLKINQLKTETAIDKPTSKLGKPLSVIDELTTALETLKVCNKLLPTSSYCILFSSLDLHPTHWPHYNNVDVGFLLRIKWYYLLLEHKSVPLEFSIFILFNFFIQSKVSQFPAAEGVITWPLLDNGLTGKMISADDPKEASFKYIIVVLLRVIRKVD